MTYLEKTLIKLIDDGCIDGIFLTGITAVGLKLLLGYVDQVRLVFTCYNYRDCPFPAVFL